MVIFFLFSTFSLDWTRLYVVDLDSSLISVWIGQALELNQANEEEPNLQENQISDEENDGFPLVEEASESSGGEESDVAGRIRIRPYGDTFKSTKNVLPRIHSIMEGLYTGPWIRWSKIPPDTKKVWFAEFKKDFFWKDKHSQGVRRNWAAKSSQHLRSTFYMARKNGKKPGFIRQTIWNEMLKQWADEDFKSLCEANKSHRACLKGLYTGGSKNAHGHVADYERKHNKRMTQVNLMRMMFRKKRTREWTGSKPQAIIDRFIELSNVFKEAHPEGMTEEDKCRLWAEAAGVNSKGQMFGQGSLNNTLPDFRNPATPLPSTALSGTHNANQMEDLRKSIEDDLRKSIEEDLRRSITEELQKTMDDKIQHLLIQARQQETRTMQQQRAQFQQMQRFVQTFQPTPYVDPILQVDTPFMALLNSTSNPSTSNSLANPSMRVGYVPPQPTSTPFDYDNHTTSGGQN